MHKYGSIGYSIDKCYILYEASLKTLNNLSPSKSESFTDMDHRRIIEMKPFDPKPLVEIRYHQASNKVTAGQINRVGFTSDIKQVPNNVAGRKELSIDISKSIQQLKPFHNTKSTDYFTL